MEILYETDSNSQKTINDKETILQHGLVPDFLNFKYSFNDILIHNSMAGLFV